MFLESNLAGTAPDAETRWMGSRAIRTELATLIATSFLRVGDYTLRVELNTSNEAVSGIGCTHCEAPGSTAAFSIRPYIEPVRNKSS